MKRFKIILALTVLSGMSCAQTHADRPPQAQPDIQSLEAKVDSLTTMVNQLLTDRREAKAMRDAVDQCVVKCEAIAWIPDTEETVLNLNAGREQCFRDCDDLDTNGCEQ